MQRSSVNVGVECLSVSAEVGGSVEVGEGVEVGVGRVWGVVSGVHVWK